jgi:hypothetical protein
MEYTVGQTIKAQYRTGVYKPVIGAWRQEWVNATLEVISPGKARVLFASVDKPRSKRQWFNSYGIEEREKGKIKLISKLEILP